MHACMHASYLLTFSSSREILEWLDVWMTDVEAVQYDDTPSPDGKALARVRDSFMKLAEEHRPSPLKYQDDDDDDDTGKAL